MTPDTDQQAGESGLKRVARAICKSRTCEGYACCQWPANRGRTKCPVEDGGYDDAARDAIAATSALDAMRAAVVCVPREPTEAMVRAAAVHTLGSTGLIIYRAMIRAALGESK